MAKFTDYTEKTEPVDTDLALIYDTPAKVNKKFTFGNLWKRKLKVMTFCMDQTKGIYLLFHTEKY